MSTSHRERLLTRLDDIGAALARREGSLVLIALGSVGLETERIDEFSDLDFFVIVESGRKRAYLDDLGWLSAAGELVFTFRNTADGFKILFADGIYGEFAVFEPDELSAIPFVEGRIVWKASGVDDSIRIPRRAQPSTAAPDPAWCVGEALTCLYVGLGRYRRGERLSAQRLVQHAAVDRIVELAAHLEQPAIASSDPFSRDRRFERKYPALAERLPRFVPGYERTPESAREILAFLEEHFDINPAMASRVRVMIDAALEERGPD